MASKNQEWLILGGVGLLAFLAYDYFGLGGSSSSSGESVSDTVRSGAILAYSAQVNLPGETGVSFLSDLESAVPGESLITGAVNDSVVNMVSTALQASGINVTNSSQSGNNLSLTIQVNSSGYAHASPDLQSVVDNAVFQATGSLPISSSIAFVSNPGYNAAPASSSNAGSGGNFSFSSFFAGLGTGAATGILLALAGVVGLVVISKEAP